ncbi:MAG: hypothetical protein K0S80_4250, partial [Neobacillus sp.]|nr:hypothetical protein [Neobacillus sp.]
MVSKFNASKYENLFNQMHGSGSFQSGINQASRAGYLKGYASVLKPYYLSALRKRMKEAQEEQERLQTVQQLKAAQSPKVQHDKMKDYMRENFGENIDTGKKYINKNAKAQPKKKQSIIGAIGNDISKETNGLKEDAQDAVNLLNPFASAKNKVKSTTRLSKKVVNRSKSVGNFFNGAVDKNGDRVNKHGLYAGVDRYVIPVSKAMDDVLTGGMNSKLMKKNATNKKGKITDPGVKSAEKNRGVETKVLHGIGTALGYAAPYEAGYGA